jgi:hypothetical protein
MTDQLPLSFVSALIGGMVGMFFSLFLPRWLFDPRLKIEGLDTHGHAVRLIVVNRGKTAATNAVGRLTIRPIREVDIDGTRADVVEARKTASDGDDWRHTRNAHLRSEDWQTGIEMEHSFWAVTGSARLDMNPALPERLVIGNSDGPWIDIPSEDTSVKRTRLRLDESRVFYGEVVVGAANCQPSRPYRFRVRLGPNKTAMVEPYSGTMPTKDDPATVRETTPLIRWRPFAMKNKIGSELPRDERENLR